MLRRLSSRCQLQAVTLPNTLPIVKDSSRRLIATEKEELTAPAFSPAPSVPSTSSRMSAATAPPRLAPDTTKRPLPQHPMELLSHVFQHHPSALRLHRELTIALANGDAARAADLASVLATTVQRVVAAQDEAQKKTPCSSAAPADNDFSASDITVDENVGLGKDGAPNNIPAPTASDVEEAMEKTREAVLQRAARASATTEHERLQEETAAPTHQDSAPFWRNPQSLCVTVLESAFETDVPGGEAQDVLSAAGNRAAEHEAEQVRILETYLEKEAARWKAQKAAVAKIVLDVARSLRVTPEDLQSTEGVTASSAGEVSQQRCEGGKRLNVLRHSNLVIRGEIPAAATGPAASSEADLDAELAALEERMTALGTPLSHEEVQMACYELQMSKSKMRYVVGVHRELQYALDTSASVQQALRDRAAHVEVSTAAATGTQLFIGEVIRALNEGAEAFSAAASSRGETLSIEDVRVRDAVESPVLPFTFMLKCCLWFDTTSPS